MQYVTIDPWQTVSGPQMSIFIEFAVIVALPEMVQECESVTVTA